MTNRNESLIQTPASTGQDAWTSQHAMAKSIECQGYSGILFIGDPHLEARVPGFRKDDYPRTVIEKLRWALEFARQKRFLPVILGDLFQLPRDNPNWLIVELLDLFDQPIAGVYGNHDVHENQIGENDSLSILIEANRYYLLSDQQVLRLNMNGRRVILGGTSWGQPFPESLPRQPDDFVVWIGHHDLAVANSEWSGNTPVQPDWPFDLLVNGHIHRRLEPTTAGDLNVVTPGNITRRKRSDMTREHIPSVLTVEVGPSDWRMNHVEVPHRPFSEVFHESLVETDIAETKSGFVTGLAELQARRTETGAGLEAFLQANLGQFESDVAEQIRALASEVLQENLT